MSRVTAPVSKLSRSLGSTTVSIGRSGSKAAAASGRIHQHDVDGSEHVHVSYPPMQKPPLPLQLRFMMHHWTMTREHPSLCPLSV